MSKWCLSQYVAMFEWGHNIKEVTDEFLGVMLGIRPAHRIRLMSRIFFLPHFEVGGYKRSTVLFMETCPTEFARLTFLTPLPGSLSTA